MRAVGLAALAAVTLVTVISVLVELRAATSPPRRVDVEGTAKAPPPAAPSSMVSAGTAAVNAATPTHAASMSASAGASASDRAPAAAASPSPSLPADPLDQVVGGKSKREWRAYYADRQRRIVSDIDHYQQVVDRAIRGEEPDPRELTEAHDQIAELRERMRQDIEALARIEATP